MLEKVIVSMTSLKHNGRQWKIRMRQMDLKWMMQFKMMILARWMGEGSSTHRQPT